MAAILEQLKRTARLPSPPGTALQILGLAQQEDVSLAQVADTLAADPALSVRILKYANSALVGVSREVTTVREAVVLLGMRAVRMMALSFSLVSSDDRHACPGFDYDGFWAHSLAHAIAARHLAKNGGKAPPEEAFAAALLASIGKLTFAVALPQEYSTLLADAGGSWHDAAALESERFGADFREAGAALLESWGIPNRLCIAVRYQCQPDDETLAAELKPLVQAVHGARAYAGKVMDDTPVDAGDSADASATIDPRQLAMEEAMRRDYREFASILALQQKRQVDVEQIQAQAGEVLSELSLAAQLRSEAVERENQGLAQRAFTDALTGVANRAAFDRRIEELWREALQTGRPIGMALLDIDLFKKFNDNFGHRTGDAVLRSVGRVVPPALRSVDFMARYGGEEFAIILPNADRLVAAGICVGVRRAIDENIVEFEGCSHHVTISVGAVVLPQPNPLYTFQMLIEAADQQLYRSKEKGRNCCSMLQLPRTPTEAILVGH